MAEPVVWCSVEQFARLTKRSRRTAFRELMWRKARDVEATGRCDWIESRGPRCKIKLNLTRLERAHPDLFVHRAATVDEVEELTRRVETLERNRDRAKKSESRTNEQLCTLRRDVDSLAVEVKRGQSRP